MKYLVLPVVISFLIVMSCAQKSTVRPPSAEESLAFVEHVGRQQEVADEKFHLDELLPRLEAFCERGIELPEYDNIELLRADIRAAMALDSTLMDVPLQHRQFVDFIAGSEFLFRFLQTAQVRLEEYYQAKDKAYAESYTSEDGAFVFHFEQNVSEMLPVTQSNSIYSEARTQMLNQLVDVYPQLGSEIEKHRFWLAIKRMLEPINLARSETGYDMFQRGADGLAEKPSQVLARLQAFQQKEPSQPIKQQAIAILQRAQDNLQSPLSREDKVLISTVELNRQFFQEIKSDSMRELQNNEKSSWFERGFNADDPQKKIEYYSRVISMDSTHAPAFNNRGNAYQALCDFAAAESDFNRAINLDPDFHIAYKNRGNLFLVQQEYQNAISDLTRAIRLDPVCPLCFADRGKAYLHLGKYSEALKDFDQAVHLDPTQAYSWNYRGLCLQKLGDLNKAVENFNRALQLDAHFVQAYINRGNVYRQMKNDALAIDNYSAALGLEPDNVIALNSRAISYRNLRQYAHAIADHDRALDIRPDDPMTLYNLGCVYWEQHKWPEVVAHWQRVLKVQPDHRLVNEWLPTAQHQLRKRR